MRRDRRRVAFAFLLSLSTLTWGASGRKAKPVTCPPDRYLLPTEVSALTGDTGSAWIPLLLRPGASTLGSCPLDTGRFKASKRGVTTVVARSLKGTTCGPKHYKHVVLRAKLVGDCQTATVKLTAKRFPRRTFQASRSFCGDGQVDTGRGEECDGSIGCTPPATCDGTCMCQLLFTTTSTTLEVTTTTLAPRCLDQNGDVTGTPCRSTVDCPADIMGHHLGCCGDGTLDFGEACDAGGRDSSTGACTEVCSAASCGDRRVEAGVEECDPGPQPGSSSPKTDDPDCSVNCKLTYCGDGIVQTGGTRPDEQCDDGNNVAGDGCSPTCQFETVSCPVGGTIDATVTFVTGADTFNSGSVAGIDLSIGYPASVSFPGSQFLPVGDPSDPASRLILLGGSYNLYDGTVVTFFDYDTSIRTVISGGHISGNNGFLVFNFPEIPFERIRFDCVSDAPLTRANFPCTIAKMVNQIGGDIPPSGQPECKVTLAP
jgi:cysteine-rich repeat protein